MRRFRTGIRATALTIAAVTSVALCGAAASATPTKAAPTKAAHTKATGWPASPDWQKYVQSPSTTDVKPVSVLTTTGDVTNPGALVSGGSGVTTLTATPKTITPHPVTVEFPAVQTRYVRLDVTALGLPAAGDPAGRYVQLAELQAFGADTSVDLAQGKQVSASEAIQAAGWNPSYLTDGVINSENPSAHGYTSQPHSSADVSGAPIVVTVDLGSVQSVSSVVLWPRTDTLSPDGQTASFPVDYSVQTSDAGTDYAVQKSVTGQADPAVPTISGSASLVLDYGHEVGGYPTFDVSAVSGSPTLQAGYSETRTQLSATGDGVSPWASGDPKRYDTYTVQAAGRITNPEIQGGERYEMITLASPGTLSLSAAGIDFTPYLATPDKYRGYFVSSSDELNKYWYDGAYTAQVNQMPVGTTGPRWTTESGVLDVPGTSAGTGLLRAGTNWTDYTVQFDTRIVTNQSGWMLRGTDAQDGYVLILDASNDKANGPGPNVLQQLSEKNGQYHTIGNVTLSSPIDPGTWHTVKEVVSGTTVTTFLDGTQVASFDSSAFPVATPPQATGSFGIREFSGEQADFRNLSVTSPTDAVLYQNALSDVSAIADFDVPGNNTVPLILDGAKRDRAVWSGDLAVEGPTLFYSTATSDYIRGSLELLGSYAGSNGYVTGDMPPQTPINTAAPGDVRNAYSASYSMYFVRDLAEYYQYTADTAFVQKEWSLVANELSWSAAQVDGNGLFATTNGNGADWDYYDGNKTGEVTAYNALYYQTLVDGVQLARATGHPALAATYATRAAALRSAINSRLFDAATGVYKLSDQSDVVAQDANVLAVQYGVAAANKVPGILAKVKSTLWSAHGTLPFSSGYQNTISPYVSGFELNARFGAGDTADALQLLSEEWGPMIAPGDLNTGTFWENESPDGTQASSQTSMAHGWSTMPTSALSKYVLGAQPVAAGYKTWLVQPHTGSLAWTKGQAPTPHGPLIVDWSHSGTDTAGESFAMHVAAPVGTSGTIAVPTFGRAIDIMVNGRKVWSASGAVRGSSAVTSATRDGSYVNLAVKSGSFDITTRVSSR
jgi:alpha-L-rhamnosidase